MNTTVLYIGLQVVEVDKNLNNRKISTFYINNRLVNMSNLYNVSRETFWKYYF